MKKLSKFLILDFGSQFTQLIARRLRELNYYSEIHPYDYSIEKIKEFAPIGIILSGGPSSVYGVEAPHRNVQELLEIAPLLGICYGMQLIAHKLGGFVEKATHREYGFNRVKWNRKLEGTSTDLIPMDQKVWMSHGDIVRKIPVGFKTFAVSDGQHPAVICGPRVWALQFHPEVAHTECGDQILASFAKDLCGAEASWDPPHVTEHLKELVRLKVGDSDHILCALSGGVDSSVVATLLTKTLGTERVHCIFVDTGLLRKNEYENVMKTYKEVGINVKGVDASKKFLKSLEKVEDPEEKRKIIGRLFIEVFEETLENLLENLPVQKSQLKWLAQGTLYPDVIESFSAKGGPSQTIKSHHNVGGLPERMKLQLLEPLRELFKDEVRRVGAELGLPHEMLWRHPFPGPGLAIRIIGEVTAENLRLVREADDIFIKKLRENNLYHNIWQAFCVLLPIKTVGVQGDERTYDQVLALRAVTSSDGMTADWYSFSFEFMRDVSNEITNKVKGINRVVYDVTSKPPGTIEWE